MTVIKPGIKFRSSEITDFHNFTFGRHLDLFFLTTPAYALFPCMQKLLTTTKFTQKICETFICFIILYTSYYYTNYGINFFFYVISGKKFRSDLVQLFLKKSLNNRCKFAGSKHPIFHTRVRYETLLAIIAKHSASPLENEHYCVKPLAEISMNKIAL